MAPNHLVAGRHSREECRDLLEFQLDVAERWCEKAKQAEDVFARFFFLYTAFNALYFAWAKANNLKNDRGEEPGEHLQIKHLLQKIPSGFADEVLRNAMNEINYFTEEREPIQRMGERTCANPLKGTTTEGSKAWRQLKDSGANADKDKLVALGKVVYLIRCNLVHGSKTERGDDETVITNAIGPLRQILHAAIKYTQYELGHR
jgi:hypothetical protein